MFSVQRGKGSPRSLFLFFPNAAEVFLANRKQDASSFTKSQLGKGSDRKCKDCTETPPQKTNVEEAKKGDSGGKAASLQCSSCNLSKTKKDFSANQQAKNEDRRCKTCVDSGAEGGVGRGVTGAKSKGKGGKKEATFECSSCGDDLPAGEYSRNQLNKGEDRKCKECVDAFAGGGRGDNRPGEEFEHVELEDLRPELQKLVGKLVHMQPEEAMETLDDMIAEGELSEDAFEQVMMVLTEMGGDGEDGEEGEEDDDDLDADEDDVIESLGLEVNIGVLHHFEREKALVTSLAGDVKRSERVRIMHRLLDSKRDRIVALDRRMYQHVFPLADAVDVSDSDEVEHEKRLGKEQRSRSEAVASGVVDATALAAAEAVVAREEGLPRCADLVLVGSKRQDDFCQLMLWARGRRFDGVWKAEPTIVKAAAAGEISTVRALLAAGASVDSCSAWAHKGMLYDRDTALVAAARSGNKELVELLLRCGADPNHTCYDEQKFRDLLSKQQLAEPSEVDEQEKQPENPYSFEPPSFVFAASEPEEDTAAIVAKRAGHEELAKLLLQAANNK